MSIVLVSALNLSENSSKGVFFFFFQRNPRPVTHQFQQNLDYYKARGADLMNKTR